MTDPILDNSTLALAIMTGVLAVATVVLAFATFWTSKLARRDADVQHRQALSGALTCNELILEFYVSEKKPTARYLSGAFKNIGNGPVVNASLTLTFPTRPGVDVNWSLGSYFSGEERPLPPTFEQRLLEFSAPLSESDLNGATLTLNYTNIFSKPQRTEFAAEKPSPTGSAHNSITFRSTYISGFERVRHT